jgi:hypothetical protein
MPKKEKELLEDAAISIFIEWYNNNSVGSKLHLIEKQAPPLPDYKCNNENNDVHIEVTHLYGTDIDARNILGRGNLDTSNAKLMNRLMPVPGRVIVRLNYLLDEKVNKNYQCDEEKWLIIRNANPLFKSEDFQREIKQIKIPHKNQFSHIYLICGRDASFGVIQL